jgi:hypothetical protein
MIFISHTCADKPVVEQIALRLRNIFGQDRVFYDSWSIQPGDGIIDRMNEALGSCQLFLFCVSKNSLQSRMVGLEWQNAILRATQGRTKLIPIKLDDCLMPPILLQSLYIDLFGQGLDIAMRQIVDITTGNNTFRPGPQQFSNLRAYKKIEGDKIYIECRAEYFLEPITHFLLLTNSTNSDLSVTPIGEMMFNSGFNKDVRLANGIVTNGFFIGISRSTTPGFPFVVEIKKLNDSSEDIWGVMHEVKKGEFRMIPMIG